MLRIYSRGRRSKTLISLNLGQQASPPNPRDEKLDLDTAFTCLEIKHVKRDILSYTSNIIRSMKGGLRTLKFRNSFCPTQSPLCSALISTHSILQLYSVGDAPFGPVKMLGGRNAGGGTNPRQAKTRPVRTKFWRLFGVESGPTTSSRLGKGKLGRQFLA